MSIRKVAHGAYKIFQLHTGNKKNVFLCFFVTYWGNFYVHQCENNYLFKFAQKVQLLPQEAHVHVETLSVLHINTVMMVFVKKVE